MACLLLLAYPLDAMALRVGGRKGAAALVWRSLGRTLLRLDRHYVLIDGEVAYVYESPDDASPHTYVPAVRVDTGKRQHVLNHVYLREWLREPAQVVWYEPAADLVQSLNQLREALL